MLFSEFLRLVLLPVLHWPDFAWVLSYGYEEHLSCWHPNMTALWARGQRRSFFFGRTALLVEWSKPLIQGLSFADLQTFLQRKSRCQQSSHKAHNSHNSDSSCRSAFHFRCSLQHRQRYSWQQRTPSTGYMSHCCFCFEFRQAPSRRLERSFKIFQDLLDPLRDCRDFSAPFANDLIGPSFARCARQGCVFLQVGEVAILISRTLSVCKVKSLGFYTADRIGLLFAQSCSHSQILCGAQLVCHALRPSGRLWPWLWNFKWLLSAGKSGIVQKLSPLLKRIQRSWRLWESAMPCPNTLTCLVWFASETALNSISWREWRSRTKSLWSGSWKSKKASGTILDFSVQTELTQQRCYPYAPQLLVATPLQGVRIWIYFRAGLNCAHNHRKTASKTRKKET